MSDYGTMQARIADELARSDLTSQIQREIQSAIAHYQRERFFFTETTSTFSTVAAQEYYGAADLAAIPNIIEIDSLRVTIGGSDPDPLSRRDWSWFERVAGPSSTGDPTDFVYYGKRLRLYPIPNAVRTMTLSGLFRLAALPADADTNAWMTDGEELIRCRAKKALYAHVIRDYDEASACRMLEMEALNQIRGETTTRSSSGRVRATSF